MRSSLLFTDTGDVEIPSSTEREGRGEEEEGGEGRSLVLESTTGKVGSSEPDDLKVRNKERGAEEREVRKKKKKRRENSES